LKNRKEISWALYDWANSAFATTIMAGFFPIFFKKYWSLESDVTESTFHLGLANGFAGLIIAIMAPILGAIADKGGHKMKFLMFFTYLGILASLSLSLVSQGLWPFAIIIYILGNIGFSGANIFYDSLIVWICDSDKRDQLSSLGFSLGYLGGGLLFALNVAMTMSPEFFFLKDSTQAVKLSFALVAIWWAIFSIPLFISIKEEKKKIGPLTAIKKGLKEIQDTLKHLKQQKNIYLFLIGYWFYIDGVDTIIRMAVDYGLSLGFESKNLIMGLLITQFIGFPATLVYAQLAKKIGTKNGIYLAILIYSLGTIAASFMTSVKEFYFLAAIIGLVQGGIQALSRSYYSRLIPKEKSAEYFGFYNMLGKFAVVIGPILMGTVAKFTGSPRTSILSLLLLFGLGALCLVNVKEVDNANQPS
jgi:UMF1 family MFS transporter